MAEAVREASLAVENDIELVEQGVISESERTEQSNGDDIAIEEVFTTNHHRPEGLRHSNPVPDDEAVRSALPAALFRSILELVEQRVDSESERTEQSNTYLSSNVDSSSEEEIDEEEATDEGDIAIEEVSTTNHHRPEGLRHSNPAPDDEAVRSALAAALFRSILEDLEREANAAPPPTRTQLLRHRVRRRISTILNWAFMPVILILAVLGFFLFLLFFCFPLLVLILVLICAYYCCTQHPIPPRTLLRALLWDDPSNPDAINTLSKEEIQKRIIRRKCLDVQDVPCDDIKDLTNVRLEPTHEGKVYYATQEHVFFFSAPIKDGEENNELVATTRSDAVVAVEEEEEALEELEESIEDDTEQQSCATEPPAQDDDEEQPTQSPPPPAAESNVHVDDTLSGDCMMCDICLISVQPNDVLAWSSNENCNHAYHADCIQDWLARRHTCPSCRQDFLNDKMESRHSSSSRRSNSRRESRQANQGEQFHV